MKKRFAKLENGRLVYANMKRVKYAGKWWFNAPEHVYKALGYREVVYAEYPSEEAPDGFYYSMVYSEDEEYIYVNYQLVEYCD